MRQRRGRYEMLADLLESCAEPLPKTRLFRRANMNFEQGETYLEVCLGEGLVRRDDGRFVVSETGRDVLRGWRHVEERVDGFGNR